MNRPYQKISNRQIAMIHVAKNQLGMDDDTYRDLLQGSAGVRSSRDIPPARLSEVLKTLRQAGFKLRYSGDPPGRPYDDMGHRPGMAEPGQLRLIEVIWREVSRSPEASERAKGLRRWIMRQARVSDLKFLNFDQAQAVIEGLKKYYERTHGRRWSHSTGSGREEVEV